MRAVILRCTLLFLLSLSLTAMAQDQGTGAGQSDQGQGMPTPQLPMPQVSPGQNTIQNSPYDQFMRQNGQRPDQQQPSVAGVALPEEQTQFQRFVGDSLGLYLPIFGRNFFSKVPSTFAPVDQMPVTSDYVIGPNDEVVIRAWGQVDIDYRDYVDRDGNIYLPKVGTLHVAGLHYAQLHSYVETAIGRIFKNFQLNTSLGSLRSIQVYVVGYASRPGSYTVSSMSTLVNAIFAAGGPSANGSMRHVLLRRGSEVVTDFDLYDLLLAGDKSKDRKLLPGDVIYFAPVGPQVALAGSVNQPAIYEVQDGATLDDVLKFGGGLSPIAAGGTAAVERVEGRRVRQVAQFSLDSEGPKRKLSDADIINISPVSARFANAVTLRGNVSSPGRHPWHEGMRVKDLIPDLYTLITERYWLQQNEITRSAQWGVTLLSQYCQPGTPYQFSAMCMNQSMGTAGQSPSQQPYGTSYPGASPYQQPQPPMMQPGPFPAPGPYGPQGQYSPNAPYMQMSGGANAGGGYNPYTPSYPQYQYQGQPFNQSPNQVGASTLAGVQQLQSGAQSALQLEIQRTAPGINWDYALVERLNMDDLTTRLLPFNLRRALTDPTSEDNLMLRPGDVVTIFSQDDMRVPIAKQSKYVYLEGEVKTPGVYKAEPGETLRDLVMRVGGLTANAYLFGAEFTRDSARREQQMRLDQAITQFEQEVQRNAAEQATTQLSSSNAATSGTQESATFQTTLKSQQQLLDRLKQVQADGRVVLSIRAWENEASALPPIELEDGDRLVVPSRPSFVNVVGAVYNTSSYLYGKNFRVRDYLREAGGGTRIADPKRTFVVRADGSVISHTGNAFTGSLMSARLMPGDTVVVPEQLYKPGFMKNLRDWSQILGQLGLAAAAIKVLAP